MISITVITPTLNAIDTVAQTFASVREQRFTKVEHIAIDGGSTDGTLAYLQSQSHSLEKLIAEPDRGITDAFNKGIREATSDYVMLLNADDYLEPDILSRLADFTTNAGKPDVVYGSIRYLDGSLEYTERPDLGRIWDYMSIFHPATLVRRDAFANIGGFSDQFHLAMDSEWFHRALRARMSFAEFPGIIATMRTGGESHKHLYAALREFRLSAQLHGGKYLRPWFFFFRQYLFQSLLKRPWIKRLALRRRRSSR